ncbi:MAG: DivIVA domain-containing protein [Candidatus Onthovivens sp.]|nr:DivIVA domain-containing protein [Candidatus Onthovivens sp.]
MKLQLTSKEILNKEFAISNKGYDANEVDAFLDKILNDYRMIDSVVKALESQNEHLRKENDKLRIKLEQRETTRKDNTQVITISSTVNQLDNLDLLKTISKYEKKLYQMGVDPSKIK